MGNVRAVARVTRVGRMTIPKEVLDALAIVPGTNVVIEVRNDREAVLRKEDRFDRALGAGEIKLAGTVDEYMELIRGHGDDPGVR